MSFFSRKKKTKPESNSLIVDFNKSASYVPIEEADRLRIEVSNLNKHIQQLVEKNASLADRLEDQKMTSLQNKKMLDQYLLCLQDKDATVKKLRKEMRKIEEEKKEWHDKYQAIRQVEDKGRKELESLKKSEHPRGSLLLDEQIESTGNQYLSTATTKDAAPKNESRKGRQDGAGNTLQASRFQKSKHERQMSDRIPISARGMSQQLIEQSQQEIQASMHRRNKTLASYSFHQDLSFKKNKLLGEIESLKTQIHTLFLDEDDAEAAEKFSKLEEEDDQEEELLEIKDSHQQFQEALSTFFNQPNLDAFQQLLESASQSQSESLAFQDKNGKVWKIVEHVEDGEEGEEIKEKKERDEEEFGLETDDRHEMDDGSVYEEDIGEKKVTLSILTMEGDMQEELVDTEQEEINKKWDQIK